jgi:dolichol-phosphate mannosyltransferase
VQVRDCTSGFRCYRRQALAGFDVDSVRSDGYCFLIEVLDRARRANAVVVEVPIRYVDRRAGASKISRGIVLEALARTTAIGLARLLGR